MKRSVNTSRLKKQVQNVFAEAGRKMLNYKQIARRLELDDTENRNEIIKIEDIEND